MSYNYVLQKAEVSALSQPNLEPVHMNQITVICFHWHTTAKRG
jgi:hypothetical protein